MHNELLKIGPVTIYGYGLMIAIGILAAYLTAERRAKKWGLDPEKVFSLTIWAVVGGILGSTFGYIFDPSDYSGILIELNDIKDEG